MEYTKYYSSPQKYPNTCIEMILHFYINYLRSIFIFLLLIAFRNALKQHRFMIKALGQRFEESAEKDQTIAKLDVVSHYLSIEL